MNIVSKQSLVISLLLISLSSCSQTVKISKCADDIDQLYNKEKIHLIFCSYYFEEVNRFSGADTILDNLSFYRDTVDANVIEKKDSTIIANLKRRICDEDTSLITKMREWCETSKRVAQIRSEVNFTLEGYMELLSEFKKTSSIFSPFLKNGRTISSLSTYEMEGIYFASINVIKSLTKNDQNAFFRKFRSWDFE